MYFLKGDATESLECLHDILDFCKTEDDSMHFISLRVQSMILMSEVQHSFSNIQSTDVLLLNEALTIAKKYHLHYLAATAEMHIANVQLSVGCAKSALTLARKILPSIMAHGSAYDMARGLLLYTKCRIANAPPAGEPRVQVLHSCCEALETVKKNFTKIGAQARLLQTWYLQAQLYNDIGNIAARNQCAWMYRQLETQNPVEPSNMLHIIY
uniref:Anaphase-promoting complex subunit 5 n=2 Tax=Pectinophora gossypiella TaxID=13191 RepID=A0A1E1VXU4_PECGO